MFENKLTFHNKLLFHLILADSLTKTRNFCPNGLKLSEAETGSLQKLPSFAEIIFATMSLFFLHIRLTIYKKNILKKDAVPSIFKDDGNITEIDCDAVGYNSCLPLSSLWISHDLFTNPETDENTETSKLKELVKKKDKKSGSSKNVLRQAKTIKGLMATFDKQNYNL